MFGSFGWMELLLILIIVLIIFGAGKLPQLGDGIGKAIKGFKKSVAELEAVDAAEASDAGAQPVPGIPQAAPVTQPGPDSPPPSREEPSFERTPGQG